MSIRWVLSSLPAISASCNVFNVGPIPPDPVGDVVITFGEAFPQDDRYFITLRYNWTAPSFQGEGITGYEVWLQREPAPQTTEINLQQLAAGSRSAETQANFLSMDGNFTLYFQVGTISKSIGPPSFLYRLLRIQSSSSFSMLHAGKCNVERLGEVGV